MTGLPRSRSTLVSETRTGPYSWQATLILAERMLKPDTVRLSPFSDLPIQPLAGED